MWDGLLGQAVGVFGRTAIVSLGELITIDSLMTCDQARELCSDYSILFYVDSGAQDGSSYELWCRSVNGIRKGRAQAATR